MPRCTQCHEIFDKLESWGNAQLCKACAKAYCEKWPEKPSGEISDIEIEEPRFGSGAQYVPDTGKTRFRGYNEGSEFEVLNHEVLHFVLHNLIGLRCCYQFDSIQNIVDPYHSLS